MEKELFEIKVMEYLAGEMSEASMEAFEAFLETHPDQKTVFDELHHTWGQLEAQSIPETSEAMDLRFFEMLQSEEAREAKKSGGLGTALSGILGWLWQPQVAYGLLLLALGLGAGYVLRTDPNTTSGPTEIVVDSETEEVREQLVLTLLEQPSANKRLQGVNEANKIGEVDEQVIKALLQTLNNDANVNVRLAAIEALVNYVDKPLVREGLIQSIVHQESPIVQVTLADLMVALQEKKSIESFKTLMRTKELDTLVEEKLRNSIQEII